jgi:hypothetical protein
VLKIVMLLAVFAAVLIVAGPASASSTDARAPGRLDAVADSIRSTSQVTIFKSLHGYGQLNAIANDIVGATDMVVAVEDDPAEWQLFLGLDSPDVLGFVIFEPAPSPLYHAILLSPDIYPVFGSWLTAGTPPAGSELPFAISAMTLIHESFHWKLLSGDESAVNACALKYFPYYLERDFKVPQSIAQTTTQQVSVTTTTQVPVTKTKVIKKRVKVKGKWTVRTTRKHVTIFVPRTTTTNVDQPVTTTVPNPLYATLVADSILFYNQQPPPYNSGVCPV